MRGMALGTESRRLRWLVLALAAVLAAAGMSLAHPAVATADGIGPNFITPTLVGNDGTGTVYVSGGTGLDSPGTKVHLSCGATAPIWTPGIPSVQATVLAAHSTWLAFTMPKIAAGQNCIVWITNTSEPTGVALPTGNQYQVTVVGASSLPTLSAPSPPQVSGGFGTASAPTINVTSTSGVLQGAKAQETLCTSLPAGLYPTTGNAGTASQLSFLAYALNPIPGAPPSANDCAVSVTLGTTAGPSGAWAGKQLLAQGPKTANPALAATSALSYIAAGPVTFTIVNSTGLPDSAISVSVMADPSKVPNYITKAPVSGFAGVNTTSLTTVPFISLPAYSSDKHSGAFVVQPGVEAGVIYMSQGSLGSSHPPSPVSSPNRYAMGEFTYTPTGTLFEDLTLIDQVGFAMSSTLYSAAVGNPKVPGSYRSTECFSTIASGIANMVPAAMTTANADGSGGIIRYQADGSLAGLIGAAKKPQLYLNATGHGAASAQTYVQYVQKIAPLHINDIHSNKKEQPGEFNYTATYSSKQTAGGTGNWTLSGQIDGVWDARLKKFVGYVPGPTMTIESASLYGPGSHGGTAYAIYGEDGPFMLSGTGIPSSYQTWGNGSQLVGSGYQDFAKTLYRDFIAGFAYGYWGGGPGPHSSIPAPGNDTGSQTANFLTNPRISAYQNAGGPSASKSWNLYDALIRQDSTGDPTTWSKGEGKNKQTYTNAIPSGAYGTAYSDTFLDSKLSPAVGSEAGEWRITLGDPPGCPSLSPTLQNIKVLPLPGGGFQKIVPVAHASYTPAPSPSPSATPSPTVQFQTPYSSSGFTPTRFTISPAAQLPAGLVFDSTKGTISGTPTAKLGSTLFTITGINGSTSSSVFVKLTVGQWSIAPIGPPNLPNGAQNIIGGVNEALSLQQFPPTAYKATGFTSTPTYSISPALPSSLKFNPTNGLITGSLPATASPTAKSYTVTAKGLTGSASAPVNITVEAGTLAPDFQQLAGTVNQPVASKPLVSSGMTAPVTFTGGPFIAGMSLNSSTGVISGTPAVTGTVTTYITGTDSSTAQLVAHAKVTFTITKAQAAPVAPAVPPAPSKAPTVKPTPAPTPAKTPTSSPKPTSSPTPACPAGQIWIPSKQLCAVIN